MASFTATLNRMAQMVDALYLPILHTGLILTPSLRATVQAIHTFMLLTALIYTALWRSSRFLRHGLCFTLGYISCTPSMHIVLCYEGIVLFRKRRQVSE